MNIQIIDSSTNFDPNNIPPSYSNSIWDIQVDIDLSNGTMNVPTGVIFRFNGGAFLNGTISFNNTYIETASYKVFDDVEKVSSSKCYFEKLDPIMFGADNSGVNDSGAAIQTAINFSDGDDVCLGAGRFLINSINNDNTDIIRLRRGVAIVGQSTFDDNRSTVIRRGNNFDFPIFATDAYFQNGINTHYYVLKGLCIDGNKFNQTTFQPAIAWYGAFVGSYIDNVFVVNNYGSAIDFSIAYDTKIGLFWANGCYVGTTNAVIEIGLGTNTIGTVGLIEFDSLYVENPYTILNPNPGETPQNTPSLRGIAIKAKEIYRLYIKTLHTESCDVSLEIEQGLSNNIKVGQISTAHAGDSNRKNSLIYLSDTPRLLDIGLASRFNTSQTISPNFKWLGLAASVISSNLFPEITAFSDSWGGFIYSYGHDKRIITSNSFYGDTEQSKIGGASATYHKVFPREKETSQLVNGTTIIDNNYHFSRVNGEIYWEQGSRVNQPNNAIKVFSRLESYGTDSDRYTDLVPRVIVKANSINSRNAFFINANDELCFRDHNGQTKKVQLV